MRKINDLGRCAVFAAPLWHPSDGARKRSPRCRVPAANARIKTPSAEAGKGAGVIARSNNAAAFRKEAEPAPANARRK